LAYTTTTWRLVVVGGRMRVLLRYILSCPVR
jgi:hypothetical protein